MSRAVCVLVGLAGLVFSGAACDKRPRTAEPQSEPRQQLATVDGRVTEAQSKQQPMVVLLPPGRDEVRVRVELARTAPEQRKGLMFREHMDEDAGMLFLFKEDEDHSFWMRNTLIPLDMIFITKELVVVGVYERAEPRTETPRSVGQISRYVLEVNGGYAEKFGIRAGTRVRFASVDAVP